MSRTKPVGPSNVIIREGSRRELPKHEYIDHPSHYGGDTTYEHIKVVAAWNLGYALGNATKYICRAGRKPGIEALEDLQKARWYLDYEIQRLEQHHAAVDPKTV